MLITRANIVKYWASGPTFEPTEPAPEGCVILNFTRPCFPDLATLSPAEKELLRPALAAHPEYLLGLIPMERTTIQ